MKVTVGLTGEGDQNLADLMETGWFESEMVAYLVAVSTALSRALVVSQAPLTGVGTKWNVGSLDKDGRLREMVNLLGPDIAQSTPP